VSRHFPGTSSDACWDSQLPHKIHCGIFRLRTGSRVFASSLAD
jgi:hypothetical protein